MGEREGRVLGDRRERDGEGERDGRETDRRERECTWLAMTLLCKAGDLCGDSSALPGVDPPDFELPCLACRIQFD